MAKDPGCGMSVDEASAFHTERDDERFSFCSERCQKIFVAETSAEPKRASDACCGCCRQPATHNVQPRRLGSSIAGA